MLGLLSQWQISYYIAWPQTKLFETFICTYIGAILSKLLRVSTWVLIDKVINANRILYIIRRIFIPRLLWTISITINLVLILLYLLLFSNCRKNNKTNFPENSGVALFFFSRNIKSILSIFLIDRCRMSQPFVQKSPLLLLPLCGGKVILIYKIRLADRCGFILRR